MMRKEAEVELVPISTAITIRVSEVPAIFMCKMTEYQGATRSFLGIPNILLAAFMLCVDMEASGAATF
jgi:hypothetical protein